MNRVGVLTSAEEIFSEIAEITRRISIKKYRTEKGSINIDSDSQTESGRESVKVGEDQ